MLQHGSKKQITIVCCGSADGRVWGPMTIVPGAEGNLNTRRNIQQAIHRSTFFQTQTGWMNAVAFCKWIRDFDLWLRIEDVQRPVVLILDGFKSHLNHRACRFAKEQGIIIYMLLSNSTQSLQPLDRSCMKPLKEKWSEVLKEFQTLNDYTGLVRKKNHVFFCPFFPAKVPARFPQVRSRNNVDGTSYPTWTIFSSSKFFSTLVHFF